MLPSPLIGCRGLAVVPDIVPANIDTLPPDGLPAGHDMQNFRQCFFWCFFLLFGVKQEWRLPCAYQCFWGPSPSQKGGLPSSPRDHHRPQWRLGKQKGTGYAFPALLAPLRWFPLIQPARGPSSCSAYCLHLTGRSDGLPFGVRLYLITQPVHEADGFTVLFELAQTVELVQVVTGAQQHGAHFRRTHTGERILGI